jgi:phosphatidylserine/phosphatidylglycerophosphate/cardiolipin synthase-like enzyme
LTAGAALNTELGVLIESPELAGANASGRR